MSKTRSGRTTKKPELYSEQKFKPGSGFSGCDSYDRAYDDGKILNSSRDDFYQRQKDLYQLGCDGAYKSALEKHMKTETATIKLPLDLANIIKKMVHNSNFKNDLEFIAPDDIPPEKAEISESTEEEEWESGSDTESECDSDREWD
jgi:hypothetical protein